MRAQNAGRGTSERRGGSGACNRAQCRARPAGAVLSGGEEGAAAFFGADDALGAGQKFVTAKGQNADFAREISRMSAPERQLFGRGYAASLPIARWNCATIRTWRSSNFSTRRPHDSAASWRWDRTRQPSSKPGCGRRATPTGCAPRSAIPPPPASLRKWDWPVSAPASSERDSSSRDLDKGHYITAALALGAAYGHHRMGAIDKSIATQIGKMLASDDPAVLQRGIAAVAKSQKLMGALRAGGDAINSLISRSGLAAASTEQALQPKHDPDNDPDNDDRGCGMRPAQQIHYSEPDEVKPHRAGLPRSAQCP